MRNTWLLWLGFANIICSIVNMIWFIYLVTISSYGYALCAIIASYFNYYVSNLLYNEAEINKNIEDDESN